MHISIVAEEILNIWGFPITNTLLTAWLATLILIIFAVLFRRTLKTIPGKLQSAVELVMELFLDFMETVAGDRKTAIKFMPIVATLFFFILLANWLGILPGVGSIGFTEFSEHGEKFVPLFRSVNSDLNMTLALAFVAVILSHIVGVITVGFKHHVGKFLTVKSPVDSFSGILEIVSEIAKVISLSFRLFGNVFAGEVLLTIIAFLVPYIAPIPFLGMELFVGLIQALIFAILAMVAFSSFTRLEH